jgi:MoaA/NifB/PqqE/SkfB family radical SAM enzyme
VRLSAVQARIQSAITAGAKEIVLSGGEPTLRRDLSTLMAFTREAGAGVIVETNATTVSQESAQAWAAAGLKKAVVNLAGDGPWLDAVTRDPGGFERTCAGIDQLRHQGIEVHVQAALVRSTAERFPLLAAFLQTRFERGIRTLIVTVPTASPDPTELLDFDHAAAVIRALELQARRVGLALKMAPDSGPPPCVHGDESRVTHLYSYTPGSVGRGNHTYLHMCESCLVRDRCPGLPNEQLQRFGAPAMTPVTTDRTRRRLSLISTVEDQIARELVTPNRYRDPVHGDLDEDVIRVLFQCNQSCRFCFVSTHLPAAGDEAVEGAIRNAGARGRKITLSGGEPLLHPRITDFVRLAKSVSTLPVLLQTNAIRLANSELAQTLAEAGLDEAFVSLHGATAEVSDVVTHAPGTFEKTVLGLDALMQAGIRTQINFVICQANLHQLSAWVTLLADRWPKAFANISFVAPSTDVVPREHALVPRYEEALPALAEAVALAESRGLEIGGFESMCGIPLCLVPQSLSRFFELSDVPPGFDAGEFIKTSACGRCSLASRCFGIRRGYVALHGESELRPVLTSG